MESYMMRDHEKQKDGDSIIIVTNQPQLEPKILQKSLNTYNSSMSLRPPHGSNAALVYESPGILRDATVGINIKAVLYNY